MPADAIDSSLRNRLDRVGQLMLDSAAVMATGGKSIPPEYLQRIMNHRKQPQTNV